MSEASNFMKEETLLRTTTSERSYSVYISDDIIVIVDDLFFLGNN